MVVADMYKRQIQEALEAVSKKKTLVIEITNWIVSV